MKRLCAAILSLGFWACGGGGSSSTSGASASAGTGGTSGGGSGGSSSGGGGQCNATVTGTPHSGTPRVCTTGDRGQGYMQLSMSGMGNCPEGDLCSLAVVVPQASGTFDCPLVGSNLVSYQESDSNGITVSAWSSCAQDADDGGCAVLGSCTVNVSSYALQSTSAGGAYGHFAGTISAHLVPNQGEPGGTTMDVSVNGSW